MSPLRSTDSELLRHRRLAIMRHSERIGIEKVSVEWWPYTDDWPDIAAGFFLIIEFIPKTGPLNGVPERLTLANLRFETQTGQPVSPFIFPAQSNPLGPEDSPNTHGWCFGIDRVLHVGPPNTLYLCLEDVPALDPFFSVAPIEFSTDPSTHVVEVDPAPPVEDPPAAEVFTADHYLARDFHGFRQMLLDRLAVTLPEWTERSPADVGMALVELLADVGDRLSYQQDAVATEAYLGTARQRLSVRRHSRLLDYRLHEGCNARTWMQLQLRDDEPAVTIPRGFGFCAPNDASLVFESMRPVTCRLEQNCLYFYGWGALSTILPKGATRATLLGGDLGLSPGDILLLEQHRDAESGEEGEVQPGQRWAVRLTSVEPTEDALIDAFSDLLHGSFTAAPGESLEKPIRLTEIAWHLDDALPHSIVAAGPTHSGYHPDLVVARGNMVLVDHGTTRPAGALEPPTVPRTGRYRPVLAESNLTFAEPLDPDSRVGGGSMSLIRQDVHRARPALTVIDDEGTPWTPLPDLIRSGPSARELVIELDNRRQVHFRFGDGRNGHRPPPETRFTATCRVGGGPVGNVAADCISRLVPRSDSEKSVASSVHSARNPFPARGGTPPETLAQARQYAPHAFRRQERCVTPQDYADVASRHPGVQRAAARLDWFGSGHTVVIAVDRRGGLSVDEAFRQVMRDWLEPYRGIGFDLEVVPPLWAPLEVELELTLGAGHLKSRVELEVRQILSNRRLSEQRLGFFHPDRLTFGQPLYRSLLEAAVGEVAGVAAVKTTIFRRLHSAASEPLMPVSTLGPLEIHRLDNDPSAPKLGRLRITWSSGSGPGRDSSRNGSPE